MRVVSTAGRSGLCETRPGMAPWRSRLQARSLHGLAGRRWPVQGRRHRFTEKLCCGRHPCILSIDANDPEALSTSPTAYRAKIPHAASLGARCSAGGPLDELMNAVDRRRRGRTAPGPRCTFNAEAQREVNTASSRPPVITSRSCCSPPLGVGDRFLRSRHVRQGRGAWTSNDQAPIAWDHGGPENGYCERFEANNVIPRG